MSIENLIIEQHKPNFEWHLGNEPLDVCFNFIVNKTTYNRFKWWIATKLFLPGWYKWTNN